MNQIAVLPIFLSQAAYQLPMFAVCAVGGILLLTRRPQLGPGATWALLGVGLGLVLCVAMPIVQTAVQVWMMNTQHPPQQMGMIYPVLGIFWAVLRAASFGLVLAGVLAGRNNPTA